MINKLLLYFCLFMLVLCALSGVANYIQHNMLNLITSIINFLTWMMLAYTQKRYVDAEVRQARYYEMVNDLLISDSNKHHFQDKRF